MTAELEMWRLFFNFKLKREISVYYFHTICGCMQLSQENQSEAGSLKLNMKYSINVRSSRLMERFCLTQLI